MRRRHAPTLLLWGLLVVGVTLGIARPGVAQNPPPDSQALRPERMPPEGVERVRRRIREIRGITNRWRRESPRSSRNGVSAKRPRPRTARNRASGGGLTRADVGRLERRLRRIFEDLIVEEQAPLYWDENLVYVPLRVPSPPVAREEGRRPPRPDTIRIADTVRIAPDTIRVPADTVRIAGGAVGARDTLRDRRIETVEERILDEGVFRAFEVNFAFGTAALQPRATRTLDAVGAVLERHPAVRIEVGGHTDAVGSEAANHRLSWARAQAVRTYLLDHFQIAPDRLVARGYGETRPVAPNDSPAGRALNRRVEFTLLNSGS